MSKQDNSDFEDSILVECSSCNAPLAKILPLNAFPQFQKTLIQCCHCGDKSFIIESETRVAISPTEYSIPFYLEEKNNVFIFDTEKIKTWAN